MSETIAVPTNILDTLKHFSFVGNGAFAPSKDELEIHADDFKSLFGFMKKYPSKWNSTLQGFDCKFETPDFFASILETGRAPKPNPYAYHPTPTKLINDSFELADINSDRVSGRRFLDPNGGSGAFLDAIRNMGEETTIHTCELDPVNRAILESKSYEIVGNDFLQYKADEPYSVICMNPPFAVKNKTVWVDHVMHAYSMLAPYGDLTAIIPKGQFFSDKKLFTEFREFCFSQPGFKLVEFPAGRFKSAQGVETIAIHLIGPMAVKESLAVRYEGSQNWFMFNAMITCSHSSELTGRVHNWALNSKSDIDSLLNDVMDELRKKKIYLPSSTKLDLINEIAAWRTASDTLSIEEGFVFADYAQSFESPTVQEAKTGLISQEKKSLSENNVAETDTTILEIAPVESTEASTTAIQPINQQVAPNCKPKTKRSRKQPACKIQLDLFAA